MGEPRTYPAGVTSWIDVEHRDVEGAQAFYGGLFGWSFTEATPPEAPYRYLVATLDGHDVAGLGGPADPASPDDGGRVSSAWSTYVAVDDAEVAVDRLTAAGGRVVQPPAEAGEGGWSVRCVDPGGVPFRLWQARRRLGAQVVNTPGAWNFSDLHAADPSASAAFYAEMFGWCYDDLGFATMVRVPSYGDHLAATSDPDIHERQSGVGVPPGFGDCIGWLNPLGPDESPHWHVSFTVHDRDATAAEAERLGATVLGRSDSDWTHDVLVRDPQGAEFTASQFDPGS